MAKNVELANLLIQFILDSGCTLRVAFEDVLRLTRWQQAPVGALMMKYQSFVREFLKVPR